MDGGTEALQAAIAGFVHAGDTVLDVGAGPSSCYRSIIVAKARELILLDAHAPYLELAFRGLGKSPRLTATTAGKCIVRKELIDARTMAMERWEQRKIDVALAIDFIEHLEKTEALALIPKLLVVAGRGVALFVPEGDHPQNRDHFGLGGDYWQTHRSSWRAGELEELGFVVERWPNFHEGMRSPGALWGRWLR